MRIRAATVRPTEVVPEVAAAHVADQRPSRGASGELGESIALSLSSAIGSLAGLLSWIVATRIVDPEQVGQASQVVSAFILVAGAAQLNLGVGILRWLPPAGRRTGRLVWTSLFLIMPLSALVGLGYVLVLPDLARTAAGTGPFAFGVLLFVLATAGWGVFVVHDCVLVAIGKPWWAVWRNAAFAVLRIGLLVALGALGFGAQGIVLSWVGPIVVWILAGSLVIAVLTRRAGRGAVDGVLPSRSEAVRFLGPTAVAQLGGVLLYNQVTVLVTERFGDETGGKFFIVWQAVTVIDITATFFMNALAVGVAREPHRAAELARTARRRLMVIFLPMLAAGALFAEPALRIVFGEAYAEADDILRLLLLGLAFRLVVLHELGVRQAAGHALGFARLQLISTVLVLGVVVVVPASTGSVDALFPVALGYVVVQLACAAAVLLRRDDDVQVTAP